MWHVLDKILAKPLQIVEYIFAGRKKAFRFKDFKRLSPESGDIFQWFIQSKFCQVKKSYLTTFDKFLLQNNDKCTGSRDDKRNDKVASLVSKIFIRIVSILLRQSSVFVIILWLKFQTVLVAYFQICRKKQLLMP